MLHSIKKLIGDKGRQLIVPIVLMSLDAIGSLVMYLMLYFTVVHLFKRNAFQVHLYGIIPLYA